MILNGHLKMIAIDDYIVVVDFYFKKASIETPPVEEAKGFSLEEKSKTSKKRVHYMKFTKGEFVVLNKESFWSNSFSASTYWCVYYFSYLSTCKSLCLYFFWFSAFHTIHPDRQNASVTIPWAVCTWLRPQMLIRALSGGAGSLGPVSARGGY